MTLIIAGYTAAPADSQDTAIYYERLATAPRAGGLELSWKGARTRSEIAELLRIVPANWVFTINTIPATFQAWAADHRYGLASPDAQGRQAALRAAGEIADAIAAINDSAGRQAVLAVEFQPAPGFSDRAVTPQAASFAASLQSLAALDWHGSAVMVEHCDAFVPGQTPQKGFLPLEDEIAGLAALPGRPIGLSLNWGRSLIELRDPDRVVTHVQRAEQSGLLRAYTFSGTAGTDNACGVAWADSHLAFADTGDPAYAEPASLMTVARAEAALAHLHDLTFLAVKTNWPAARRDPRERAASVLANFATMVELLERSGHPLLQA